MTMASEQGKDKAVREDVRGGMRDDGDSEVWTVPPGGLPTKAGNAGGQGAPAAGFGDEGSNAGEVDPGVAGRGEMLKTVGGMGEGDAVESAGMVPE
jgi:hypothetical protein